MPKVTRAAARNRQGAIITEYGQVTRKKRELTEEEKIFYGELSRYVLDYRQLPPDDPYRQEIERSVSKADGVPYKRPCTAIGSRKHA